MADVQSTKKLIRERVRAALAAMAQEEAARRSALVCERVVRSAAFGSAGTVLVYAPAPGEVDVTAVALAAIRSGKVVCVPRVDWASKGMGAARVEDWGRDLVPGRHGIREPRAGVAGVEVGKLDLILVPGVAFDAAGNRQGRGAGFYDRFLADPGLAAATLGVCFEAQLIDRVPVESWDVSLDFIATEDRLIEVR